MAVCVTLGAIPKFSFSSADHARSLLPGRSATAAGTSGKPIVGPHLPTTDGFVLSACALTALLTTADSTSGAPMREIPAALTEDPEPAANDRVVSLTKRVLTGAMPTCLVAVVSAHVPEATVTKW